MPFSREALLIAVACLAPALAFAHRGRQHGGSAPTPPPKERAAAAPAKDVLQRINESYVKGVKAIFAAKCMTCHSTETKFPWYYGIPGAKQLIDHDVAEAREHLDMSNDFPFAGHGDSPLEDLDEIRKAVLEGTMPPWRYRLMHRDPMLTDEEKRAVIDWIGRSERALKGGD